MNIGIIGAGHIGGALGKLWAQAGHRVFFSSRRPETLRAVTEEAGPNAQAGTVAEATAFADVILFAPPFWATDDALQAAGELSGKIVLDATNPYKQDFSGLALPETTTAAAELAKKIPNAAVVKAYNTLPARVLAEEAHHPEGERIAVFYSGDHAQANAVAAGLIADSGFAALYVGPLAAAALQEPRGPLYAQTLPQPEAERLLATTQR